MEQKEHEDIRGKGSALLWGVSVLLAAGVALLCLWKDVFSGLSWEKEEYSVVLLGDSIVGNHYNGKGIAEYLQELSGKSVLCGGFGGTCASYEEDVEKSYSVSPQLSLIQLARAVRERDLSVQKAQVAYGEHYHYYMNETMDYFMGALEALEKLDFAKVDYLVIEHGVNDYNQGCRLDNPEDSHDTATFGGAMRCSIEIFQRMMPDAKLILMTPTWCYYDVQGEMRQCDEVDFGGGLLEEYVELEFSIAEEYGIYLLDNYHGSGIGSENGDDYLVDGLHLNALGQQKIAQRLADLIGTM